MKKKAKKYNTNKNMNIKGLCASAWAYVRLRIM